MIPVCYLVPYGCQHHCAIARQPQTWFHCCYQALPSNQTMKPFSQVLMLLLPVLPSPGLLCAGNILTPSLLPCQGSWVQLWALPRPFLDPAFLMYSNISTFMCTNVWICQVCQGIEQRDLCWIIDIQLVVYLREDTKGSSNSAMTLYHMHFYKYISSCIWDPINVISHV